jgi:hypothetical protein
MSIVSVQEQFQPVKYLIVSNQSDPESITTTRIIVSDLRSNTINLVTIEKGPQGERGLIGPSGPAGRDGLVFDVLPVNSGGTNNTIFNSGYLISYDGNKLASTQYTISDLVEAGSNSSSITGVIAGTGLQKTINISNTVTLDVNIGEGLTISNDKIIIDDSIVRRAELNLGSIEGTVPISKGGTNNSSYSSNKLIYYNGTRFVSFPLNTGSIVVSGSAINIVAGSGLVGGGLLSLPSGSVALSIAGSVDILVEENSISLSNTGVAGTYQKVVTDDKGRVVSGSLLTTSDILNVLGYTPWHPGNDGAGSTLDADLLDGQHGSYYLNGANITGIINSSKLSDLHASPSIGTKFRINTKGLIEEVYFANTNDIITSLGYRPLNSEADDSKQGSLTINGDLTTTNGSISFYDNLPLFGTNRPDILPSEPRGFTFTYGGIATNKTGLLAYYPTENQLKLVTNVFSSGSNIDGNEGNQDDINGGNAESIFIVENLDGDAATVLFREIADQLYINTTSNQTIYGLKRFLGELEVLKQIKIINDGNPFTAPPIVLNGNTVRVTSLNADLLDDQHGSYYRNAGNITGAFSYQNVTFDHINGTTSYIPKFNDTQDPARKIDSSNIKQRIDGDIEISNEQNLIVGDSGNSLQYGSVNVILAGDNNRGASENSIAVGNNNRVAGLNSMAVGQNNITSGNNSVAMNLGSVSRGNQSIALGSYGLATLPNQLAFGAFRVNEGSTIVEHGQYSTVAMYLQGTSTNGGWTSLTPVINLPQDKTIAYNIELLINKGFSSGVAHFIYDSGIINNATFRNPNNITEILNRTTIPNPGSKKELFNNSQLRRHYHFWNYTPNLSKPNAISRVVQYINSTEPPVRINPTDIRHVKPYYFHVPEQVKITGTYYKNNTGSLILDVDKPRYSGSFTQNSQSPDIKITSDNHGAVINSLIEIQPIISSKYFIPPGRYKTLSVIDNNNFYIETPIWTGTKVTLNPGTQNAAAKIKLNSSINYDSSFIFDISGSIQNNIINLYSSSNSNNYPIKQIIRPDSILKLVYNVGAPSFENLAYRRSVVSVTDNSITINSPIYSKDLSPIIINGNIRIIYDEYSAYVFKTCDGIYVNSETVSFNGAKSNQPTYFTNDNRFVFVNDGGAGTHIVPSSISLISAQNAILSDTDVYNEPSFSIILNSTLENIPDGATVSVRPIFNNNTGLVELYHRSNYPSTYSSVASDLNKHTGIYYRKKEQNNKHKLYIYDSNNNPINFISNPARYEFADGYGSEHNSLFEIRKSGERHFLYTKNNINYETNNLLSIKLNCFPYQKDISDYQKTFNIVINDLSENPIINYSISKTGIIADNLFLWTLSPSPLIDPENESMTISAEIKGGHPLPRWLDFNSSALTFSGIPNNCDIGMYSIDLKAIDSSGLIGYNNFIIEVSGNLVSASEFPAYNFDNILNTQNIILTNNTIDENTPIGTKVGEIVRIGGYDPYINFHSAENSFSGVFSKNSDLVRNCKANIKQYVPVAISGSPEHLSVGVKVTSKNIPVPGTQNALQTNTRIKNIYKPSIFSGTQLYGNKIILNDSVYDHSMSVLFTGLTIPDSGINESFGLGLRIKEFNDYSITIADYLVQDQNLDLILTENNEPLRHDIQEPTVTYFIDDELFLDNLAEENGISKLKYRDYHGYDNVIWSNKNTYGYFYSEDLHYTIDSLISDNISDIESLSKSIDLIDVKLKTENNEKICDEEYYVLHEISIDNTIWSKDTPIRIRRSTHSGISSIPTTQYPINPLKQLVEPESRTSLLVSNIDYTRTIDKLYEARDDWAFLEPTNNSVLYVNTIGRDDYANILSEDRNYSGTILGSSPFEYALLSTEDGYGLISDNKKDHGSRIELSHRYELLDSVNVYNDNGIIFTETLFNSLICENNDRIVHDYAISAKSGSAYILFPAEIDQLAMKYPKVKSFSSTKLNNGSIGYYEDNLELLPNNLQFDEPNYYYSWGKLVAHRLRTTEYVLRLDKPYLNNSATGIIVYSGEIPDSGNYFPELLNEYNYTKLSGDCPEIYYSGGINGFRIIENFTPSGEYVTGLVTFYPGFTSNTINITSQIAINKDVRTEDHIYLHAISSPVQNAQVPRTGTYKQIKNIWSSGFSVENLFLYPSPLVVNNTGSISVNLDRNHQQVLKNSKIVNRIPIKFNTVKNSNINRLPKDNLFDIENISGNKIYTTDNLNYLLKSNNYPDYLDDTLFGKYITNGCSFLGSLFHNKNYIYDIRPEFNKIYQVYSIITFEYDVNKQQLKFNIPSGTVKPFDQIKAYNFQPLNQNMQWDETRTYNTGFLVLSENISQRVLDETPDKDFVLLERSSAFLQPENSEQIILSSNIFANSASGTCILDTKIANRLQQGYLLNYADNIKNQSGHQVISIEDGYRFSGVIPKNHKIISSTGIINDHRIGFSSVFNTGAIVYLSGLRSVRYATQDDIGFTELYKINATGFLTNETLSTGIVGKGSTYWPYRITSSIRAPKNNRFIEFLYLGHNDDNTINFSGSILTHSTGDFVITKIDLQQQQRIEYLKKLGVLSGVSPIIRTGSNGIDSSFYASITGMKRFDVVQIDLHASTGINTVNSTDLYVYMTNTASPLPLVFDTNTIPNTIDNFYPKYSDITKNLFHILPSINTTNKYCNNNKTYNKNNTIFYNGNIISISNLRSINSFSNYNDQLELIRFNNQLISSNYTKHIQQISPSVLKTSITGISTDGEKSIGVRNYTYPINALRDNEARCVNTFGTTGNIYLPNTGTVELVNTISGSFDMLSYNNIYVQSHGDTTSNWPQDTDGVLVQKPITGIYSITPDIDTCTSGTLCVIISGYKNTSLIELLKDKSYYFDFSDGFSERNGVYQIKDHLSPTVLSLSIPYYDNYSNKSGLVYIIDNTRNYKSHLNPNLNNSFVTQSVSMLQFNSPILKHQINYYDSKTKKWTHVYHLNNTLNNYSIYPLRFDLGGTQSVSSNLVYNTKTPISITNISLLTNSLSNTFTPLSNNTITTYSDVNSIVLKLSTSGGSPILNNSNSILNIPKIYISGIGDYRTITNNALYGYRPGSGWDIGIELIPMNNTGVFPLNISARDETGSDTILLSLRSSNRPKITQTYPTGYATLTSLNWNLYFDIEGVDLITNNPNDQGLYVSGTPNDLDYDFIRHSSSELELVGYPAGGGFSTGIWNPVLKITDISTGYIIASGTGTLRILDSLNDRPAYKPVINKLKTDTYINLSAMEKISFSVPVYEIDQNHSTIITSLDGGIYFSAFRTSAGFDANMQRFNIEYTPRNTGDFSYLSDSKYAVSRPNNFTVSQPIYVNGNQVWNSYTSENYTSNYTFYRPIIIDTTFINDIPEFKLNEPWSIQFVVDEGATKHRPETRPRVTLYNTPGIGNMIYQYHAYNISYKYDTNNKNWIVTAVGKPDDYGSYAPGTGLYNIHIFADDNKTSTSTASITIRYINNNYIDYILPNIYATPNNEFFINADVTANYSESTNPYITMDGENSIDVSYGSMRKVYQPNLGIWELSITGNKLIDKWDSRLVIDSSSNPSVTVQCKGIATDKITAVAKINLLELQNANRDAGLESFPIEIVNVAGNTAIDPVSGIIVSQGIDPWRLNFSTRYGLASPLHPPTIILEGTPTLCTGYNPDLDPLYSPNNPSPNLQGFCLSSPPSFSTSQKAWNFSFSGTASCSLLGVYDFKITAIDTDLSLENPYIEPADTYEGLYSYLPNTSPHPGPVVVPVSSEDEPATNIELKPFCNSYYYQKFKFFPTSRSACPAPTGLTGIIFSGSLPSGLSYSWTYPDWSETNRFHSPIYDNTGTGTVIIQGYPLAFAQNGDTYNEQFGIIVVDARNRTGSTVITFNQSVTVNQPNIGLRVYFDSPKPVYTPGTGLKKLIPDSVTRARRPEATVEELQCYSSLPSTKNNCPARTIIYSGLPLSDSYMVLKNLDGTTLSFNRGFSSVVENAPIYIELNNNSNNSNNGVYRLRKTTSVFPNPALPINEWYINTKEDFSPRTGIARIVLGNHGVSLGVGDFSSFFDGDIQNTYSCVLGNGVVDVDRNPNGSTLGTAYGIRGFISPSFSGYIPNNGSWATTDFETTGLAFSLTAPNPVGSISYVNCWETGILRVSGVLLPKIYAEITDPPPAQNRAFGDNSSTFALNPRLSYGDTIVERSNFINWRSAGGSYKVNNLLFGSLVEQGSISYSQSSSTPILLTASTLSAATSGSGTVYSIDISSNGSVFPTYNYTALPKADPVTYYWIHKAGNTYDVPTVNSFPPIIPCYPSSINIVSGVLINYINENNYGIDSRAIGGYVPHDICPNNTCPQGYANEPYYKVGSSPWLAQDYIPKISGIILSQIETSGTGILGQYSSVAQRMTIDNNTNIASLYDYVQITVSRINDNAIIETFTTGLISNNFSGQYLVFTNRQYGGITSVNTSIKHINRLLSIDTNNHKLTIRHKNLNLNPSDIIVFDSKNISSSINALNYDGYAYVDQISSTGLTISIGGTQPSGIYKEFNIGDHINLYQYIEDNIKIMPNNITSNIEGIYDFIISGRGNILFGKYKYRILTKENSNMPIFNPSYSLNFVPKAYFKDIDLYVAKPLSIASSSINWVGNSWTATLVINGGALPALSEMIDVQIDLDGLGNYAYCGFDRHAVGSDTDSYNSSTGYTTISLRSNNRTNWSAQTSFTVRVSDKTGSATVILSKP